MNYSEAEKSQKWIQIVLISGRKPSGIRNLLKKLGDESLEDKPRRKTVEGKYNIHQPLRHNFMTKTLQLTTIKTP
jgi:hypothetical protein